MSALSFGDRPWYRLTLPGTQCYPAFKQPAIDPLLCWPDEYQPTSEHSTAWGNSLKWDDVPLMHGSVHAEMGFQPCTVNYAFNNLFHSIPIRANASGALVYDVRGGDRGEADFVTKKRNFMLAWKFIATYPTRTRMKSVLGIDSSTFTRLIWPTIFSMSRAVNYIDFNLRLWDYNRGELFPERVLTSWDGFPTEVCASSNKWVSRLTKSKKYGCHVVKNDLGIALCGFIVGYSGPHLGVRNDTRMWSENHRRRRTMFRWEYAAGDKAYIGCPEFICEYKGSNLPPHQLAWNEALQFYRGRNEHLVALVKNGSGATQGKWRGSFLGLSAVTRLVIHMAALQERMNGPRYDVFGPWPVCPNHIVAQYL